MTLEHGPIGKRRPFAIRGMAKADLARLEQPRQPMNHGIARLRHSHHMIARLTAAGLRIHDVAQRVGYTRERVGQLLQAPAMQELVASYAQKIDRAFEESVDAYFDLAQQNMVAAERHIRDRIAEADDAGELLGIREALAISRDAADRFGYGKRQTNVNVNADFGAILEQRLARLGKTIDGAKVTLPTAPLVPSIQPVAEATSSPEASPRSQALLRRI